MGNDRNQANQGHAPGDGPRGHFIHRVGESENLTGATHSSPIIPNSTGSVDYRIGRTNGAEREMGPGNSVQRSARARPLTRPS